MTYAEQLRAAMQATTVRRVRKVDGPPEWGTMYVRDITVAEVDEQDADTANKNDKRAIARSAARVLCDENGQPIFDPHNAEDVEFLAQQPWKLLRRVLKDDASGN